MSAKRFTGKQQAFINFYCQTLNGVQAARLAGYKGEDTTLAAVAYENLRKPHIKAAIEERMEELTMGPHEVLKRLAEHARASIADFIDETGVIDFQKVKEKGHLVKKVTHLKGSKSSIEIHDPQSALVQLGRHYVLFSDKVKVEDWRSEWINEIKERRFPFELVSEELGDELATELFISAGVPISED